MHRSTPATNVPCPTYGTRTSGLLPGGTKAGSGSGSPCTPASQACAPAAPATRPVSATKTRTPPPWFPGQGPGSGSMPGGTSPGSVAMHGHTGDTVTA